MRQLEREEEIGRMWQDLTSSREHTYVPGHALISALHFVLHGAAFLMNLGHSTATSPTRDLVREDG